MLRLWTERVNCKRNSNMPIFCCKLLSLCDCSHNCWILFAHNGPSEKGALWCLLWTITSCRTKINAKSKNDRIFVNRHVCGQLTKRTHKSVFYLRTITYCPCWLWSGSQLFGVELHRGNVRSPSEEGDEPFGPGGSWNQVRELRRQPTSQNRTPRFGTFYG